MDTLLLVTSVLVVPLALLLFAQWPLREWVQAWSRQANDAAQIVFAVYVAVAITTASRTNSHLAAVKTMDHKVRHAWHAAVWRAGLVLACVGPWALFMLWAALPNIVSSVMGLEKFGETLTPGFFLIKLALGLLLLLVLVDAFAAWLAAWRHNS
jgi:hypothetical protein